MGELICPNCGGRVVLPEHSELCMGITFSKESSGTHYLNMEKENTNMNNTMNMTANTTKENKTMTKAEMRMETLRKSGADMSKYFRIDLPTGGDMLMEW